MNDYRANVAQLLSQWWQSPLGQYVQEREQYLAAASAAHFFGYHQLQIGGINKILPTVNRSCSQAFLGPQADVVGLAETLPFRSHSIDNLLLVHVLEFSADPHQVLREAERVLVDDGRLIVCSFNPISLWGWRRLFSWQNSFPWQGHFFTHTRIKDWLALLNFEVIHLERVIFSPPVNSAKWLKRIGFLERWGKRLWPFFGGVTFFVASKRTVPLTPLATRWRKKQLFPSRRLVNRPITRDKMNG